MRIIVKRFSEQKEFVAGDGSVLREFLNPLKESLALGYSLAHAKVGISEATRPHMLQNSEVYYIIDGEGRMFVDANTEDVRSGCVVYIPPGATQHIENTGSTDLEFICIVDPAWNKAIEEVW